MDLTRLPTSCFYTLLRPFLPPTGFKPTTDGRCVCDGKYFVNPKGNCVRVFNPGVIIAIIVGGLLLILLILLLIRVALRRAADAVWQIRAAELEIVQPVEVLGRGKYYVLSTLLAVNGS